MGSAASSSSAAGSVLSGRGARIWSLTGFLKSRRRPAELPDGVVLDGELVAWRDGVIRPFADLQQRIGRKKVTAEILKSVPVRFLAYDLLEEDYEDLRLLSLRERRARLEKIVAAAPGGRSTFPR